MGVVVMLIMRKYVIISSRTNLFSDFINSKATGIQLINIILFHQFIHNINL